MAAIASACTPAQAFTTMARERRGTELDAWIAQVAASELADLQRFAAGLLLDRAAVHAGLVLEWSNGQTEGQVNRLKTVKRQMYGRGGGLRFAALARAPRGVRFTLPEEEPVCLGSVCHP